MPCFLRNLIDIIDELVICTIREALTRIRSL